MGDAIGQILGYAAGVLVSPMPTIAVILLLFSRHAKSNGVGFLLGWLVGLDVITLIFMAVGIDNSGDAPFGGYAKLVIGVLFLLLMVKQWRSRPAKGETASTPGWMSTLEGFSPVKSFGLAVVLVAANPKNLGLTIAAASTISSAGLSRGAELTTSLVYVLTASLAIIVPVAAFLLARDKVAPVLDELKAWLIQNNAIVMAGLFLILGVKLIGDSVSIITA